MTTNPTLIGAQNCRDEALLRLVAARKAWAEAEVEQQAALRHWLLVTCGATSEANGYGARCTEAPGHAGNHANLLGETWPSRCQS